MSDDEDLAREFAELRPRLVGVAYGLLGSVEEAEDVVQDAWLRLSRQEPGHVGDVAGWLVVTVSRLALDVLRSVRHRREEYVGPWLPEPVVTGPEAADPADRVTLDESMSIAMMVVLESLSPAERTAFVLHDVFGLPFEEIAVAVGRTPAACRQLAARARRHVAARAPRFSVDGAEHRRVVDAFARACEAGDLDALLAVLDPDVVLLSDGGGLARAARRPILGDAKVARFLLGVAAKFGPGPRFTPMAVNGWPGLARVGGGRLTHVFGLAVADGRVTEIDIVINPEKLRRTT
ncbi:RNA polymerase sigma-70 factor (ECF subfamily) [Thermocatellispora tengchongensis]|uniref:RNA polymerase sigma-70 factor (ECF subfamily) n=1 Tax=Thermocatellispora tengchongensis TaxID=1073253 RepID=A0A840P836_9ACTN|nr:RNA polymerase sigma factor SigJ [Thermocatellispora tengchongensis]MBB5135159.1 RNA polymerase sigma-70 factor (ECF subfamily) [Thermocatellispora tengchongensis]